MSEELPVVVSFGGGTNSTAMLCGFRERGIVPALICFADTGGELPHTYEHVEEMDKKCREWWGLGIETVRKLYKGQPETLEQQCLRTKQLPSLAYGKKQCSVHFKGRPQDARQRQWAKRAGVSHIVKMVGFGADEPWRIKPKFNEVEDRGLRITSRYPLVEWNWRRADCYAAIYRHGIKQPGKSSCFFCPSRSPSRVLQLRQERPDLFNRGVALERNAETGTREKDLAGGIFGLNFGTKWSDIAKADDAQAKLFEWAAQHASPSQPCGCYDG
jgi:hypothetical protein